MPKHSSNAGGQQSPPPLSNRQYDYFNAPQPLLQIIPPHASLGNAGGNPNRPNGYSPYICDPVNFPHSNAMREDHSSRNSYGSKPDPQHGFKYLGLGPFAPNANTGGWTPSQQLPQERYHRQDYFGHSYDHHSSLVPTSSNPISSISTFNSQPQQQRQPLPPLPPRLPTPAYSFNHDRARWDIDQRLFASAQNNTVLKEHREKEPMPQPPLPPPPGPHLPRDESESQSLRKVATSTDTVVDAMSALSNLSNRWSTSAVGKTGGVVTQQNSKVKNKRKNRKKKKKNSTWHDDAVPSKKNITVREPGEINDAQIDMEDDVLTSNNCKLQNCQNHHAEDANPVSFNTSLSLPASKKFNQELQNSNESTHLDAFQETLTSQPMSYAAVLGGVLEQKDNANEGTHKNQDIQGDDDDEQMDISEEEEEFDNSLGFREMQQRLGKHAQAPEEKVIDSPQKKLIDLTVEHAANVNGRKSYSDAPNKSLVKPPDQTLQQIDKEKRALKICELRAKAKLARAKLRIAEQKKARGNVARECLDSDKQTRATERKTALSPKTVSTSPLPTARAITVGNLVIEDVSLTGQVEEVRFGTGQEEKKQDLAAPAAPEAGPSSREALKSRLELARLQLKMMKKKEQIKRKALLVNNENKQSSSSNTGNASHAEKDDEQQSCTAMPNDDRVANSENQLFRTREAEDTSQEEDHAYTKLEQLRIRQKELKQKNDIANLGNLIRRQRLLLEAQGQELKASSSQLNSCVESINIKKALLKDSEQRLQTMQHRKRIVEGMVMRATEQLIGARKTLSQKRGQQISLV